MALIAYLTGNATWATSFQHRDFRFVWVATLLHSMGMGMEQVALGWLVLDLTDSPFMVGVSAAARMAPFFFLGLLSGAVADRVDRRMFLRVITLGSSVAPAVMVLVIATGTVQMWHIMGLAVATGCFWAFVQTARQAYIYDIVGPERALNGMALSAVGTQIGGVGGSLLAGLIIATVGVEWQYLALSASAIASATALMATRHVGQAAAANRDPVFKNLLGYLELIRQNRTLMVLMCLAATTELFGFTHMSLLPVFAKDVLGIGALGLGVMTAFRQFGGFLGLMLLASLGDFRRKGMLMFVVAVGFGLGQMAFSLTANVFAFVAILCFVNACAHGVDTLYKTLMQANVANEERGRAMGAWVLSIGVAPVGHVGVGAVAGALGAPGALLINGGILTVVSVAAAIGLPRMRRLE